MEGDGCLSLRMWVSGGRGGGTCIELVGVGGGNKYFKTLYNIQLYICSFVVFLLPTFFNSLDRFKINWGLRNFWKSDFFGRFFAPIFQDTKMFLVIFFFKSRYSFTFYLPFSLDNRVSNDYLCVCLFICLLSVCPSVCFSVQMNFS